MQKIPSCLNDKVSLNVLAHSTINAKKSYEVTGGIDLDNFQQIALAAGFEKRIPHVYRLIIEPKSGRRDGVKDL